MCKFGMAYYLAVRCCEIIVHTTTNHRSHHLVIFSISIHRLDVIKTRRQSGKYDDKSVAWLLRDIIQKGDMYRGLSLGLLRSFIANGASMEVYTIVERELKKSAYFRN